MHVRLILVLEKGCVYFLHVPIGVCIEIDLPGSQNSTTSKCRSGFGNWGIAWVWPSSSLNKTAIHLPHSSLIACTVLSTKSSLDLTVRCVRYTSMLKPRDMFLQPVYITYYILILKKFILTWYVNKFVN